MLKPNSPQKEKKAMSNITKTPQYSTMLFTDVWSSVIDFKNDYEQAGIYTEPVLGENQKVIKAGTKLSDASINLLFYLLYSKYGNNPIANRDVNQFKFKVFSIIFQYGPTWEKKLDIQESLRALGEEDIQKGSKAIYNTALNPSTQPSNGSLEELNYINSQNTTNYKKSKLEAYGQLWVLLDTDVTGAFVNKFKVCFKQFVRPEKPLLYITESEEGE